MLVLTRRPGEIIRIQLAEDVDPEIPAGQLFADGPIELVVTQVKGGQVKLGISADRRFLILRDELIPSAPPFQEKNPSPHPSPGGRGGRSSFSLREKGQG